MKKYNWLSYKDAKKFVSSLKLKSKSEWYKFSKSKNRPKDIPANPSGVYKNKGWKSWGDFLGTGRIATFNIQYRSFSDARKLGHTIKARTSEEWRVYSISGERPIDIPSDLRNHYKNKGWKGWCDFLNTKGKPKKERYKPFNEARKFVRSLKLKNQGEWAEYCKSEKKPDDIPYHPDRNYKEWKGMGDWLGTGYIASQDRKYRSYNEARKFVRSLKFKNFEQWKEYTKSGKKPDDIPANPYQTYENKGWLGMGDFLGTGRIANQNRKYRSFSVAKKFVRSLKLTSQNNWAKYSKSGKRPNDIPGHPDRNYKEWKGWGDFLGTGRIANQDIEYIEYEEAEKAAHILVKKLGIKSKKEWIAAKKAGKIPDNLPTHPWIIYRSNRSRWKK